MRTSSKRTTVAVLRSIIGLKTPEFSSLLALSMSALEKIESGRLKLSEEVATRISHETGVSIEWLLDGNPSVPPVRSTMTEVFTKKADRPLYTKEDFEYRRANRHEPQSIDDITSPAYQGARMVAVLLAAIAGNEGRLADYRAEKFLCSMEETFGRNEALIHAVMGFITNSGTLEDIAENLPASALNVFGGNDTASPDSALVEYLKAQGEPSDSLPADDGRRNVG